MATQIQVSPPEEENKLQKFNTHESIPEDGVLEGLDDDGEHAQDWSRNVAERETWAAKEIRRNSTIAWSKIELPTPKSPKEARRGSVLSMWAPGKDKDGKDILLHNDDHGEDDDDLIGGRKGSVSGRSEKSDGSGKGEVLKVGETDLNGGLTGGLNGHRKLSGSGAERRGSILSLWRGQKDAHGKDIIGGDDEEWKD